MAEKFDLDAILKEQGYIPPGAAPEKAPQARPATTEGVGSAAAGLGKAFIQGVGTTGVDIDELMARASPEPTRSKGMQDIARMREMLAPAEDETMWQKGARLGGEYLPLGAAGRFMTPLESIAAKVLPTTRQVPSIVPRFVRGAGGAQGSWVPTVGTATVPSRIGGITQGAARIGDPAITGAAAGMIGDPQHPQQGAEEGAITGGGLAAVEALLSKGGLARTLLGNILYYLAHKTTGLPYHPVAGPVTKAAVSGASRLASRGSKTGYVAGPAGRAAGKALKGPDEDEDSQ
jgi:hypothetical protein